jgi:hypothetical protein
MTSLQERVDHHVREEEHEMCPRVTDRMPEDERAGLGRVLATRKRAAMPPTRSLRSGIRGRKRTAKRAAPSGAATPRRVRKTTAKAKKRRTASRARAARRR